MTRTGPYFKQLRLDRGIQPETVAAALSIDPARLASIECGRMNATKIEIVMFARYFGVDEQELLIACHRDRVHSDPLHGSPDEATGKNRKHTNLLRSLDRSSRRYGNLVAQLRQLEKGETQIRSYKPGGLLGQCVEHMIYYSTGNAGHDYERLLPDGTIKLFIALDDEGRMFIDDPAAGAHHVIRDAWLTGAQMKHITLRSNQKERTLCLCFKPGGFYGLTGIPPSELSGTVMDAVALFGVSVLHLKERLASCFDNDEVFRMAENYFTAQIKGPALLLPVVQYVLLNIERPVSWLAGRSGFSPKHLVHLFKKQTGFTPKYYQRMLRFNNVLHTLQRSDPGLDWTSVAFHNNYYDQAHFIREFNHFTGLNPRAYLETGSTCPKFIRFAER